MIIQRCSTTGDYVAFQKINGKAYLAYAPTIRSVLEEMQILMQDVDGRDPRSKPLKPKKAKACLANMVATEEKG